MSKKLLPETFPFEPQIVFPIWLYILVCWLGFCGITTASKVFLWQMGIWRNQWVMGSWRGFGVWLWIREWLTCRCCCFNFSNLGSLKRLPIYKRLHLWMCGMFNFIDTGSFLSLFLFFLANTQSPSLSVSVLSTRAGSAWIFLYSSLALSISKNLLFKPWSLLLLKDSWYSMLY